MFGNNSAASQFAYAVGEDFGSSIRGALDHARDLSRAKAAKEDYEAWMIRAAESGEVLPVHHQRSYVEDELVTHVALKVVALRELGKLDKDHPMTYSNKGSQAIREEIAKIGLKNFNAAKRPLSNDLNSFAPSEEQAMGVFAALKEDGRQLPSACFVI